MNSSKRQSSFLETSAHESVYVESNFAAISSPKTHLVAVHGLGTYGGWFNELSESLAEKSVATTTFDLPAFGRSGRRGEVSSYRAWIEALKLVWVQAHSQLPGSTFLLGHSLGGVIALAALKELNPKPAGVIITVPGFLAHSKSFPLSFIVPTFFKAILGSQDKISYSFPPEVFECVKCKLHQIDFLTAEVKPKVFLEILKVSNLAWLSANKFAETPLLMFLTGKDQTCVSAASGLFFNLCNSQSKTLKNYPELGHDLFVLPEAPQINEQVENWLREQLQNK
jgi:alpha-beta hydrolase superfamily lysophospholipase